MVKLKDIFDIMEQIAPPSLAMEWDRVGLQVGDPEDAATGVMVALDPSIEALDEASNNDLNLLITHHPLFLSPLNCIDLATYPGKIIKSAVEKKTAIFSTHTNLDCARGGVNDILADILEIEETKPLESSGTGAENSEGLGRIGRLKKRAALRDVVAHVKGKLEINNARVLGDMKRGIERVAVCGGSGGSLIGAASKMGADLLISGDIRYHQAREAEDLDLCVIDVGHFSSEKVAVGGLAAMLRKKFEEEKIEIPVREYDGDKEPFTTL